MDTGNLLLNHEYGKGGFEFPSKQFVNFKEITFPKESDRRLYFSAIFQGQYDKDVATRISRQFGPVPGKIVILEGGPVVNFAEVFFADLHRANLLQGGYIVLS